MPFNALHLRAPLLQAIKEHRYAEPTPIQAQAIPPALAGRDLIATAQTGTGKTAAFVLPILQRLTDQPRGASMALILTPTRELAQQIESVCRALGKHTHVRAGLVVGGAPLPPQERMLRAGTEIVVATPGRLLDHMRQPGINFPKLQVLVLDEADRMLDMGFLPDIKRIVARLPAKRQTLFFSATMPPVIEQLAKQLLRSPVTIQVGHRTAPAVGITQAAYPVPDHLKTALLRDLLRHMDMPSALIFTRTKQWAKRLTRVIAADGFTVAELHSNRTQAQRTKALEGFRRGAFQVLVATNIAARGIDVDHITHVISFDVPDVPDDYVHRIGRTARAHAEGDAFILVSPQEERSLSDIERQIGQRLPRVTLPDFDYKAQGQVQKGRHGKVVHNERGPAEPQPRRGFGRSGGQGRSGGHGPPRRR